MAVIKQLKNFFTGMIIYPKTLTKAVYDENGERLDKILRDTMLAVEDETYNGVEPRDADTLGGKYTSNDIKELKENVTQLNTDLNSLLKWKFLKTVTGKTEITLPATFNELLIEVKDGRKNNTVNQYHTLYVAYDMLTDNPKDYYNGHCYAEDTNRNYFSISMTKLVLSDYHQAGSDVTNLAITSVYYR